jgi:hypothetical protein
MVARTIRARAAQSLMRAIHTIEAAQHTAAMRECQAGGLIDQSAINEAKDRIHAQVQKLEA